jgi:hypothetical protein
VATVGIRDATDAARPSPSASARIAPVLSEPATERIAADVDGWPHVYPLGDEDGEIENPPALRVMTAETLVWQSGHSARSVDRSVARMGKEHSRRA